ncbi:hypothetical protein M409DRAFT_53825 [Zasmidium cellare ATCC 36951]|uniref:Uncharacterized protein n=1 Tax=Zasmidium cellare ATCC 36951 TaxID=1080233 RepID=A0A6A6CMM0_ZASCE|nr:uncharacterized protein M409DRAFT_53825 [Zasmidium cellare ATCC 36951]KAF2167873.1 hypothetical protein M409DRAFT_53825 [Zasmidium cellare ATCC 36951]
MAFTVVLTALALSVASLICSVYFLQHVGETAASPILIAWVTLSAAISYVLLCFTIITYIRQRLPQQPRKDVESPHYRISRRSIDTDTDDTITPEEVNAVNQHHSASTFYYCNSSFAAIHLNSALSTPRTPQTVIRHPQRHSSLLPPAPVTHPFPSPQLSTKLCKVSKLNLSSMRAVVVNVPSSTSRKGRKEGARKESLDKIRRATSRRIGTVPAAVGEAKA